MIKEKYIKWFDQKDISDFTLLKGVQEKQIQLYSSLPHMFNNHKLGMDLPRMNCLRRAFSSSIRFFSSGSFALTFLFSSNNHLKSSRCWSSGIGSRNFTGWVTDAGGTGLSLTEAATVAASGVVGSSSSSLTPFLLVLVNMYATKWLRIGQF